MKIRYITDQKLNILLIHVGTDSILWNNAPLDQRLHDDANDKLTRDGGVATDDYFKNLPESIANKFPMLGTLDRGSSNENSLYLPERTLVYLLSPAGWLNSGGAEAIVDLASWTDTGNQGNYFGGYTDVKIYKRILSPGYYTLDNYHAYFLFTDPLETSQNPIIIPFIY